MTEKNLGYVCKSNALIEASYRLELNELRIISLCISKINSVGELSKKDEFSIDAQEFSRIFLSSPKNAYRDLELAANDLFNRKIRISNTGKYKNGYTITRWVQDIDFDRNSGKVTLAFARKVVPYLSQLRERFTMYKLSRVSGLKSAHAIRLYELGLQYSKIKKRKFTVEELKTVLGVENLYPHFKDFNKFVIKPSVEQVNKFTDIKLKLTTIKKARTISDIVFDIEFKDDPEKNIKKNKGELLRREFISATIRNAKSSMFDEYFKDLNKNEKNFIGDKENALFLLKQSQYEVDRQIEKFNRKISAVKN